VDSGANPCRTHSGAPSPDLGTRSALSDWRVSRVAALHLSPAVASPRAYFRRHALFLAIDALKPEKGNRALYVVRELKVGLVLHVLPCSQPIISRWRSTCSRRSKLWGIGCAAWSVLRRRHSKCGCSGFPWSVSSNLPSAVSADAAAPVAGRGPGLQKALNGPFVGLLCSPAGTEPSEPERSAPSRFEAPMRFDPLHAHRRSKPPSLSAASGV